MSSSLPAATRSPPGHEAAAPPSVSRLAVRDKTVNGAISSKSSATRVGNTNLPSQDQPNLRESRSNLSETGRQASKKKSGGMLGFLRLREPSTSALEDFADQERKRAAQKGGRAGMSGISSQRLPDHVPKVNSKWNGLPEPRETKQRKDNDRSNKEVVAGARYSVSSYGSTASQPNSRIRMDARICSHSTPPRTAKVPALHSPVSLLHCPLEGPADSHPDIPELPVLDSSSGLVTSPEASPRTPALEEEAFPMPSRNTNFRIMTRSHKPPVKLDEDGAFVGDDAEIAVEKVRSEPRTA